MDIAAVWSGLDLCGGLGRHCRVVLTQNTQNRDSVVLHLKLDELIRVTESARNRLLDLEDLTEEDLKPLKRSFARTADTPDSTHLQKAANELDVASEGIQEAKQNVGAVIGKAWTRCRARQRGCQ
jgi:low affinity Fe/Cu permease